MDIRFICQPLKNWPEIMKNFTQIKFSQEDLKGIYSLLHLTKLSDISPKSLREQIKFSQPADCGMSIADYEKVMVCALFNGVITLMPILEGGY